MKSKLEMIYKPPIGYSIDRVLIVDSERTVVFLHANTLIGASVIELLKFGLPFKKINLSLLKSFDTPVYAKKACTIMGDNLIVFMSSGEIAFLDLDAFEDFQIFKVAGIHGRGLYGGDIAPTHIAYNDFLQRYIVTLSDGSQVPRYISNLLECRALDEKFKVESLVSLPTKEYPKSKYSLLYPELDADGDWVHIRDIFCIGENLYVHTLGCSHPRVLGGVYADFSFVSVFDSNLDFILNYEVEEGLGSASFSKKYFLVNPRKNNNKIYFYNTEQFFKEYELSLTPKQNLGCEKNKWIKFDMIDDVFLLYSADFLHFCSMSA